MSTSASSSNNNSSKALRRESALALTLSGYLGVALSTTGNALDEYRGIWLVGTNTGGSVVTCVAADDPRVRGAALLSPRADFDDWAAQPRRFLEHARDIGAIRTPSFPPSFDEWARELRRFRPVDAARRLAPRPLLVMHGDDDDSVPTVDARQLAEAHGAAELRLIPGAGHRLRLDPRAIAVLLGWLDRQRQGEGALS